MTRGLNFLSLETSRLNRIRIVVEGTTLGESVCQLSKIKNV